MIETAQDSKEMMDNLMYRVGKKWFIVWKKNSECLREKKKKTQKKFCEFDMSPFSSLKIVILTQY